MLGFADSSIRFLPTFRVVDFMDDLLPIASRVTGVFLVMVAGGFCRKTGWLTVESDRSLANLTANVLLPALFFDRMISSDTVQSLSETWFPPLVGFLFTVLGFGMGALVAHFLGPAIGLTTTAQKRAFILCAGIANYGYIPLPLAQQFYPDAEVSLIIHNVGVDMALWSLGIMVIAGRAGTRWRRIFGSPPLLAVLIGLGLKQAGGAEWIPQPVLQMTQALGACAIPLGLLLSGAIIVDYLPRMRWHEGKAVLTVASLLRLVILPVLMLVFAKFAVGESNLKEVLLLQAAMPAATFPIVLVRLYDQDVGTAVRVALGTSVIALVSIPLWMWIGAIWLGLSPAG